jgi:dephospho-CoA kinase
MRRIGLTGGIGSGKTTVARMLAERGAVVIDADAISRELVEPGSPALIELAEAFGPGILRDDGSLNRGALAQVAFTEPGGTERLNAIMHPRIRAESERRLAAAVSQGGAGVVVYDMPLLLETGQQSVVDLVLVVDVPEETQLERATGERGLDADDVRRRMAAQVSRAERLAAADIVIDNAGSLEATRDQVERVWSILAG